MLFRSVAEIATSMFSSARTLSVHMYSISGEGLYIKQTYATAVVLLVVVILINALSGFAAKKIGGNTLRVSHYAQKDARIGGKNTDG